MYPFFFLLLGTICGLLLADGVYFLGGGFLLLLVTGPARRWTAAGAAAAFLLQLVSPHEAVVPVGQEAVSAGTVLDASLDGRVTFESGPYVYYLYGPEENYPAPGDYCRLDIRTWDPEPPATAYSFDYSLHLERSGIYSTGSVKEWHCLDRSGLFHLVQRWRAEKLKSRSWEESEAAALAAALVYGERSFITEERTQQYQQFGVIHLLAVSGLHVGVVSGVLWLILVRSGLSREGAAWVVIAVLPLYAAAAGGAPSVVRASLMTAAGLLLYIWKGRLAGLDIIGAAGLLLLLFDSNLLHHLGFQLSFLTTSALLLSRRLLAGSFMLWKVTLTAQAVSLPLVLFHFYEVSPWSLPANLVFVPAVTVVLLPLSFAAALLPGAGGGAALFLSEQLLQRVHRLLDVLEQLPGHPLNTGAVPAAGACLLFVIIVWMLYRWERKGPAVFLLLIPIFGILIGRPYVDTQAYVHFIDVGQGDAVLIELAEREKVYLIDTGGELDFSQGENPEVKAYGPGRKALLPLLKGRGIERIDKVILSHGHTDHLGELCLLVDELDIGAVHYPMTNERPSIAEEHLLCAQAEQIPIHFASAGEGWETDSDSFRYLHPQDPAGWSENDLSLVLQADIEGVSFLFTGDIEEEAERKLIGEGLLSRTDVLKVPHHGSNSSSTAPFISSIRPKAAVIQAGLNNRHGHPHQDVLDRYEEAGTEVYRTDAMGTITFTLQEGSWEANCSRSCSSMEDEKRSGKQSASPIRAGSLEK